MNRIITVKKVMSLSVAASILASVAFVVPKRLTADDDVIVNLNKYNSDDIFLEQQILLNNLASYNYEFKSVSENSWINSNAVPVKENPDDESETSCVLDYASRITTIGKDVGLSSGWTKILFEGTTGYVRTEYLSDTILLIEDDSYLYLNDTTDFFTEPDDTAAPVLSLEQNTRLRKIGHNDEWTKVEYEGQYYYISPNFCSTNMIFTGENKTVYASRTVNLKTRPISSDEYNSGIEIPYEGELQQVGYNKEWIRVIHDGYYYYVMSAYTVPYKTKARSQSQPNSYTITLGASECTGDVATVVETAYSFLNAKYVWGAATPTAMDCSGLTMQCYAAVGISLPHQSSQQANYGRDVMNEELKPGDLLMFSSRGSSRISHVAMYVGDGMMIHAANSKQGVIASDLNNYLRYGGTLQAARRFIEQ